MMHDHTALQSQARRASVSFLMAETDVGITFADIALRCEHPRRIAETRSRARAAYQAAIRYSGRVSLTDDEAREIGLRLSRLRARLQQLGESL